MNSIVDHELTEQELLEVESKAEQLFTVLLQEDEFGKWTVNVQAAEDEGVDVADLEQIAQTLNEQPMVVPFHAVNSAEYRQCVLNAVGLGGLTGGAAGGGSQLAYLIAVKNWKEVAWVLARLVGVTALKGGVAGAAAALAGAGAWCATPWAS